VALDTRADADATPGRGAGKRPASPLDGPVAIEVRDVEKVFRIPARRITRLKERLVNPFARQEYRRLHALRDVSFDIHKGEFFGIVGRNGSGKSTLLKIMASIYRADSGRVRMAGSVAPFIELGVGFDMELSARENIVLNGVMMGLTPSEARNRLDAVLDFAELQEFDEVKLKNYSSGMLVRLAFSVMIQADTEILLIDEVLAVGDAAFQQKCADVFHQMRDRGKTVVLVTHDMSAVEHYCHRALLLNNGELVQIGDASEVAKRYLQLNFEQGFQPVEGKAADSSDEVRLLDVWLEDTEGSRITNVEQGQQVRLRAQLETKQELSQPRFGFVVANADDVYVHEFSAPFSGADGQAGRVKAGERVSVSVEVSNRLAPDRYFLHFGVGRTGVRDYPTLWVPLAVGFIVFGDEETLGVVTPEHRMEITTEEGGPR
jgi:ABC-type polysaccharide/polyol phosphate transport system ATPase subunit